MEEAEEQEFDTLRYTEMGLCGCGRPYEVESFVVKLLELQKGKNLKDIQDAIKATDPDIVFELIFHLLENKGFVEHGFSVYGSSLTDKGNRFLELYAKSASGDIPQPQ
jgi:hypothetical protein